MNVPGKQNSKGNSSDIAAKTLVFSSNNKGLCGVAARHELNILHEFGKMGRGFTIHRERDFHTGENQTEHSSSGKELRNERKNIVFTHDKNYSCLDEHCIVSFASFLNREFYS